MTAGPIVLPPGNERLAFNFAPIRLRSQDSLRFHYRLDGFDKGWSPPTAARTADYTNLPPGTYHFRVQVFDLGNPDSVSEVSMEVRQKPHFYRTWWFITASLLLIGLGVFGAYRYRMRQVRSKFEAVLDERAASSSCRPLREPAFLWKRRCRANASSHPGIVASR